MRLFSLSFVRTSRSKRRKTPSEAHSTIVSQFLQSSFVLTVRSDRTSSPSRRQLYCAYSDTTYPIHYSFVVSALRHTIWDMSCLFGASRYRFHILLLFVGDVGYCLRRCHRYARRKGPLALFLVPPLSMARFLSSSRFIPQVYVLE